MFRVLVSLFNSVGDFCLLTFVVVLYCCVWLLEDCLVYSLLCYLCWFGMLLLFGVIYCAFWFFCGLCCFDVLIFDWVGCLRIVCVCVMYLFLGGLCLLDYLGVLWVVRLCCLVVCGFICNFVWDSVVFGCLDCFGVVVYLTVVFWCYSVIKRLFVCLL